MEMNEKLQGKMHVLGGKITGDKKMEMKGKLEQAAANMKERVHNPRDNMSGKMPKM